MAENINNEVVHFFSNYKASNEGFNKRKETYIAIIAIVEDIRKTLVANYLYTQLGSAYTTRTKESQRFHGANQDSGGNV